MRSIAPRQTARARLWILASVSIAFMLSALFALARYYNRRSVQLASAQLVDPTVRNAQSP